MPRLRLLILACLSLVAVRAAERRPNFVFIYSDDQRWDAMGVVQQEQGERARYPWLKTPHMDRIAEGGARFRNAFVTLSLCAPSRAAFLTGRYNHLNGVADNSTPFPENNVTHATLLRAAGYRTAYIGKWHMGNQRGARPGFDYSASFIGQGKYFDCPFEINGTATPTKGWVDDVSTDYAIGFIRENQARPFSLVLGFKTSHVPLEPPPRARERFTGEEWRVAPSMQPAARAIYRAAPAANAAPAAKRPTNLNYFRCLSAIDDCVGRVLDTLDSLGLTEDTVVVFASDNGFYQGEHGLGDKRSAYDESLRIPLLLRYPRAVKAGLRVDPMVLNLDLAPTFLEWAGVPVPREMQGRSVVPLVTGRSVEWRRAFFYEYFQETAYPQTPTMFAVRTDTAKLIVYPGHEEWTELFDLAQDPYELRNLAADPAHQRLLADMRNEFARQRAAVDYRDPPAAGAK